MWKIKVDGFNELEIEESEKIFGKETNKLVLQNIGSLVCEFLIHHFAELFSYDYTKLLEEELDEIATRKLDPWFKTCINCATEIDKQISTMTVQKQQYRIDDQHVLVYEKYGPVIKVIDGDKCNIEDTTKTKAKTKTRTKAKKPEYISIKRDIKIDLKLLSAGEYTLEDLMEIKERNLGKYGDSEIILKSGKYGYYIEWSDSDAKVNKKSVEELLKNTGINSENLSISDIVNLIKDVNKKTDLDEEKEKDDEKEKDETDETDETEEKEEKDKKDKNVIRKLTENLSIRKSKYGAYIYYKTEHMEKPSFYNLKGFRGYTTCSEEILFDWIKKTHNIF